MARELGLHSFHNLRSSGVLVVKLFQCIHDQVAGVAIGARGFGVLVLRSCYEVVHLVLLKRAETRDFGLNVDRHWLQCCNYHQHVYRPACLVTSI